MNIREKRFTKIYQENIWGGAESKSGKGSDTAQTEYLKPKLIELINKLGIKILIDAPCGDCHWIYSTIPSMNITKYIGIDIVSDLIKNLQIQYAMDKNMQFEQKDIVTDSLPKGDLLLCRDCLVHLSYEEIKFFLQNFINSEITYLLTTTFSYNRGLASYVDNSHFWHPLVLWNKPISLPLPIELINEQCTQIDSENSYEDKSLGLWTRNQIKEAKCGT